jgi:hypothetical protein
MKKEELVNKGMRLPKWLIRLIKQDAGSTRTFSDVARNILTQHYEGKKQ